MTIGLDHFQITVPKDSELKAKTFYCEFMGLQEIDKPDNRKSNGGFWLKAGNFEFRDPFGNRIEIIERF